MTRTSQEVIIHLSFPSTSSHLIMAGNKSGPQHRAPVQGLAEVQCISCFAHWQLNMLAGQNACKVMSGIPQDVICLTLVSNVCFTPRRGGGHIVKKNDVALSPLVRTCTLALGWPTSARPCTESRHAPATNWLLSCIETTYDCAGNKNNQGEEVATTIR